MAPPTLDLYRSYLDDPTLSDLTLKLSDRAVHVHRIVLCRASEYFTSLLTGSFQESTSKEVELHGDDPEAMMALLAHIYGQPYSHPDGSDPLHKQALLFVAAEEYQLSGLQEDTCGRIKSDIEAQSYEIEDFYKAAQTIFSATRPDSIARAPIVQECIGQLQDLRDDDDFVSLLQDAPDLGIAIIKHSDLKCESLGNWVCDGNSGCGGLPSCSACWGPDGRSTPFEASSLKTHRSNTSRLWLCPSCNSTTEPDCSECRGNIAWTKQN